MIPSSQHLCYLLKLILSLKNTSVNIKNKNFINFINFQNGPQNFFEAYKLRKSFAII